MTGADGVAIEIEAVCVIKTFLLIFHTDEPFSLIEQHYDSYPVWPFNNTLPFCFRHNRFIWCKACTYDTF